MSEITKSLAAMDAAAAIRSFGLVRFDRVLKTTASLCPACLKHVPAIVYTRGAQVRIAKQCAEHGASEAVLENDARYYFLSNKDRTGRCYADDRVFDIPAYTLPGQESCCDDGACGTGATDQLANKTCTILVEVTNACNLACTVCYSDAKGDRKMPLADFQRHLAKLIAQKGGLDSVQLTGGEALLHPELDEMIAFLHAQPGVKKIYLPTNGIVLSKSPARVASLARFRDKLVVLLQFDGDDDTNRALRDATPARVRERVIGLTAEHGIFVQLTMTIARGVNEDEVGWVIDTGLRHEHIKVIALQPATYSGRYQLAPDAETRLTLSDVVKAVHAQARLRVREEDFVPIPCSHPNCGWITLFVRRFGVVQNVMKHVDLPRVLDQVAYKTMLSTDQLRESVGTNGGGVGKRLLGALAKRVVRSTDMFTVAVKPFMDRFSYDQDRIANCCHHTMDLSGNAVSFCEHNAILRPDEPWDRLPLLS